MKDTKAMDVDEFIELRAWAFRLLKDIAEKQMSIVSGIDKGSTKDWELYIKKKSLQLTALGNARSTVDSLIKNIDSQGDIANALKKIEAALQDGDD